jgi:hypothetical protein
VEVRPPRFALENRYHILLFLMIMFLNIHEHKFISKFCSR